MNWLRCLLGLHDFFCTDMLEFDAYGIYRVYRCTRCGKERCKDV